MADNPSDQEVSMGLQGLWDNNIFTWSGFRKYTADDVHQKFSKLQKKWFDRSDKSLFLSAQAKSDKKAAAAAKRKQKKKEKSFDTPPAKLLQLKTVAATSVLQYCNEHGLKPLHVSTSVYQL